MRELKFRAWNKVTNKMQYPINLEEIRDDGIDSETMNNTYCWELGVHDIEDLIWQQYTGLKDKNGVEIYEGDIMRVRLNYQYHKTTPTDKQRRRKYIVGYRCGIYQQHTTAEYQLHILSEYFDDVGGYCGLSDIDMRDSEVIGNIYEHPELLK